MLCVSISPDPLAAAVRFTSYTKCTLAIFVLNRRRTVHSQLQQRENSTDLSCISGVLVFTFIEEERGQSRASSGVASSAGRIDSLTSVEHMMRTQVTLERTALTTPVCPAAKWFEGVDKHKRWRADVLFFLSLNRRQWEIHSIPAWPREAVKGGKNKPKLLWPFWVTGHLCLSSHGTDELTRVP